MSTKTINIIKGIAFIFISLYLAFTYNDSLINFISKVQIVGWVPGSILLRVVISLAFARGIQLIYKAVTGNRKPIIVFLIATLVGFTIVFIAQPIYTTDYGDFGTSDITLNISKLKDETNQEFKLNSKSALVIFFSTSCKTCREMSYKIGDLQISGNSPQIIALFPGTEEDAITFLNENNGRNFKHHMIDNDEYFQESASYVFPSIFLVDKNGEPIEHWEGSLMNYTAFDLINAYK